jgi:hypothetical protein
MQCHIFLALWTVSHTDKTLGGSEMLESNALSTKSKLLFAFVFSQRFISLFALTLILLLSLLLITEEAIARTYYVSPSGNNSNTGLIGAPFNTIQKAADIVNPGDTVIVKDGVYTDTNSDNRIVDLNRAGNSSNWITFKAENKWGAKLNGQNNTTSLCWFFGVNAQYVRVEGFEVYGCTNAGFHTQDADYGYLYKNNVHDIGRRCTNEAYGQSGIFTGTGATHWTFDSNVVHHIGRYRVGENGCQESVCKTDLDRCGMLDPGMYLNGAYGDVINNVFYENSSSNSVAIKGSYCAGCGSHYRVINNTFGQSLYRYDATLELIACDSGYTNYVDDVIIENNLFATNRVWNTMMWCPERMTNIVIKNNMTKDSNLIWPYGPQAWGWNPYTDPDFTISGNYENTSQSFVDYSGYNFRLQSNSPAIDKGINTGLTYDAEGKSRTGNPDIGAYEYVDAQVADTTTPTIPTALSATSISSAQINLSWTASTDPVITGQATSGVAGYKIYRNGTQITTTSDTNYSDTGLLPLTMYTYTVSAYHAAGNVSAQSNAASATTLSPPAPGSPTLVP